MNISIEWLQEIAQKAEAAALAIQPGVKFVGAFGDAEKLGFRDMERSLFTTVYLSFLPGIWTDNDGTVTRIFPKSH